MEWLISSNYNMFDLELAFNELPYIDWRQTAKYEIGDIVYIYETKPISAIRYKAEVIKNNIPFNQIINDKKYEKNDYNLSHQNYYSRLKLLSKFDSTESITLNALHNHGLIGNIQGPRKLYTNEGNLLSWGKYIQDNFNRVANIEDSINYSDIIQYTGKEREAIIKIRVNQSKFRDQLIRKYKHCCLCNVESSEFLIASHIKPWHACNQYEKIDVNNGFLLCPNHDRLFDAGYISFHDTGEIMISPKLSANDQIFLNVHEKMNISISEENKIYLKYHRENIFKK